MPMPGDPSTIIELGPGGAFVVQGPSQLMALPTTGAGGGSLILNSRVLLKDEVSAGGQRLDLISSSATRLQTGPRAIAIRVDATTGEMLMETDPGTDRLSLAGAEIALAARSVGQGLPLVRITDANASDQLVVAVGDSPPGAILRASGGMSPRMRLESSTVGQSMNMNVSAGTGLQALYIVGPGFSSFDVYAQLARNLVTGAGGAPLSWANNLLFSFSGLYETGRITAGNGIRGSAPVSVAAQAYSTSTKNLSIVRADSNPEVLLGSQIPGTAALPTPGIVEIDVAQGGALRFGTYGRPVSSGGPASFNDRFRIEDTGDFTVQAPGSPGSPGSQPVLALEQAVTGEASLTAGRTMRGRVFVKHATGQPSLLVQQGDDGKTVYWSAWRDGSNISLRASLTVPTSAASGVQIVSL